MDRSLYSLVLLDDVVRAVDRLAYDRGTSRSALINQILAEYVSLLTPEKRIEEIFHSALDRALRQESLQVQRPPSPTTLTLRSAVQYKYNPTIRYSVEIGLNGQRYVGAFRSVSRSTSSGFLARLSAFYQLWARVERECLAEEGRSPRYGDETEEGRFTRELVVEQPGGIPDSQKLGEAIGAYIYAFDRALDLSFANTRTLHELYLKVKYIYINYMEQADLLL